MFKNNDNAKKIIIFTPYYDPEPFPINNFVEESERHQQAAIQYAKFYRSLNMELSMNRSDRQEFGIDFCKISKAEYDRLLVSSPEIPVSVVEDFNRTFTHICNKPDVANGLTNLRHDC